MVFDESILGVIVLSHSQLAHLTDVWMIADCQSFFLVLHIRDEKECRREKICRKFCINSKFDLKLNKN